MQLDHEAVQMPMSFPVQASRPITPGTTNVDEPPATALPPPPPAPPVGERPWNPNEEQTHDAYGFRYGGDGPRYRRVIDDEISLPDNDQEAQVAEHEKNRLPGGYDPVVDEDDDMPDLVLDRAPIDGEQISWLFKEVKETSRRLENQIRNLSELYENLLAPLESALVLSREQTFPAQVARYHEQQRLSARRFTLVTLNTAKRELEIEGLCPRPGKAIIDTGASSIVLGKDFALSLQRCANDQLIFGDTFVTARGTVEKTLGKTKAPLKFVLAGGTAGETTITAPVIIADTNVFDVLLGMDFIL